MNIYFLLSKSCIIEHWRRRFFQRLCSHRSITLFEMTDTASEQSEIEESPYQMQVMQQVKSVCSFISEYYEVSSMPSFSPLFRDEEQTRPHVIGNALWECTKPAKVLRLFFSDEVIKRIVESTCNVYLYLHKDWKCNAKFHDIRRYQWRGECIWFAWCTF